MIGRRYTPGGRRPVADTSWPTSSLGLVVWLSMHDFWPVRLVRKKTGHREDDFHVHFVYPYKPVALVDEYFRPGNVVRKVLDLHGRICKYHIKEFGKDSVSNEMPFEKPLR